jgi:hypothetical protein
MSRVRKAALGIAAALVAASVVAVPSASAQTIPFENYEVGGTLSLAKLRQSIELPDGSTFNGSANLATGELTGNVFIPEFTSTIRVLGIPT